MYVSGGATSAFPNGKFGNVKYINIYKSEKKLCRDKCNIFSYEHNSRERTCY